MNLLIVLFLIAVLYIIAYIFIEYFAKNKNCTTILLFGIEITIVGLAFVCFGNKEPTNYAIIYNFIGLGIVILGLCISILGLRK